MNDMHLYATDTEVVAATSPQEAAEFWANTIGEDLEDHEDMDWRQLSDDQEFSLFYFEENWDLWEDKSEFDGAQVEVHERRNFTVKAPVAWWLRNLTAPTWMGSSENY